MQINDKMVEAARASLYGCNGNPLTTENIRTALSAALSALVEEQQGAVKALEWSLSYSSDDENAWAAPAVGGVYTIRQFTSGGGAWLHRDRAEKRYRSISEAKAAAQSDYESRIRSALVDVPAAIPTANCCICGRIIDTREKSEGGDDHGDETAPAKWTCSIQCYDAFTGYVPDVPAVESEPDLDARMKAAGMYTIAEMMGVTPLTKWKSNPAINTLDAFSEWLDRKVTEYLRMKAGYDLGDKSQDDELFEWVEAHAAVFGTIRDQFEIVRSAIAPAPAEETWQPIETAPKDKSSVLVAIPGKGPTDWTVCEAYFDPEHFEGGDWWLAGTRHDDWGSSPISDCMWNNPTQWRPLPAPPSLAASEGSTDE